ncbi:UNVERIFIED_CONTAM: UDP-glycosyltransferase 86A2 [Sesamum radiatum]|uniref:UDP-glycosyltransferase 86A2 n=1 Tax=Sesamum radiatum TaxID=300843 RepID=A0AAW2R551_SESRA
MGEHEGHQSLQKPHFIIIPPPFQGHINPSVQLTLKLASRGFTVTFVNTEFAHEQIRKSRKHHSNGEDDHDDIFAGSVSRVWISVTGQSATDSRCHLIGPCTVTSS